MKIFLLLLVILSAICGLNSHCVRNQPDQKCEERIFPEPEPKEIHYIYHGESCDCPKYHDTIVEKPVLIEKPYQPENYQYDIAVPTAQTKEESARYVFDVRVEKPIKRTPEKSFVSVNYAVQAPKLSTYENGPRYMFDTHVEKPIQPCQSKPWQGLVAQVDRISMPGSGGYQNQAEHAKESCDCGCQHPTHPKPCTCGKDYTLPIIYNSRYAIKSDGSQVHTSPYSKYEVGNKKFKRDLSSDKKQNLKRHEMKMPNLNSFKKVSPKELRAMLTVSSNVKPRKTSFKRSKILRTRQKRKPDSPCGYTYESCDPKKHNKNGCPLCYRCKCEPVNKVSDDAKFSPYDIKIPYQVVSHGGALGTAPKNQEFDYEPSSYIGLKDRDMYKKYIQQVVAKYPEHMSRKMPDVKDQERDLLKFIGELSQSSKSPGDEMPNEDIRYKLADNAMDMYKHYEKAMSKIPKVSFGNRDGKQFKKRGTVLEVFEVDSKEFTGRSHKIADHDFDSNISESQ